MNLSPKEIKFLFIIAQTRTIKSLERKSDREFDFTISGTKPGVPCNTDYSAWVPLLGIREFLDWNVSPIAEQTDYPDMVLDGDWSGVRDSSEKTIWMIFSKYVPILIKYMVVPGLP